MILYFSGTGNSLAISRQLAERLGEQVMPLGLAVKHDLSQERRIGFVLISPSQSDGRRYVLTQASATGSGRRSFRRLPAGPPRW